MPTDAWPLDSPMLPPLVLRPPHGPRLVRLLVMVLAGMFHLGTAGWSVITNGSEGDLAWGAQSLATLQMTAHCAWWTPLPPGFAGQEGPLLAWLMRISFTLFGINEFTARLPTALGVMATVWFTMRLAERFGGIWRGFVAALILICCPGMFTLGRVATALPLVAAFITAAFYFLECAWSTHPSPVRRRWLFLAWVMGCGAVLAGGWMAGGVIALGLGFLLLFFREARLRFRPLLSWEGGLILILTVAAMAAVGYPPGARVVRLTPGWVQPVSQVFLWQIGLLFPWSLLLLPAVGKTLWQLARFRPLEWNEALPLAWLVSGLALTVADSSRFFPMVWWPAFALWAALQLATLHRQSFLHWCGLVVVTAAGGLFAVAHMRELLPELLPNNAPNFAAIPDFFWFAVTPVAVVALLAFLLFAIAALGAEWMHNRRFALLALFAAMIPAGFALADIGAKFAAYFSDAALARCIRSQPGPERPVVVTADLDYAEISSLGFYLGPDIGIRGMSRSEWKTPPSFVMIPRHRLAYWKENLPGAAKVECTEGEHLLLSVQP
jgi:hypothetical protein